MDYVPLSRYRKRKPLQSSLLNMLQIDRIYRVGVLFLSVISAQSQTFLNLSQTFDADAVLEQNGLGIGEALDAQGRRIDAASLPGIYADGSIVTTQDGRAKFKFGPFKQNSLDAMKINGQIINVAKGSYESLDLAMLSVPGALADPFGEIELRYTDGTQDKLRLGPVPGWFNSPTAFDHILYRYTDSSQVQTIASFQTDFSDTETAYIVQSRGNGNSGGNRFVDGNGYVLYRLGDLGNIKQATLGVTVGNNFVISVAAEYSDPDASTTDGFTVVANSMVIYNNFEHRSLGNLKQYDIDLAPFLAKGTGEIYVLLTDATTANGWGPYIQRILLYTGKTRSFEQILQPSVDVSKATVHAMFQTGTDAEKTFLYDNAGSGPSNRGHRFADGSGTITYRFDLPDTVTNAKLTMDIANNFVVSLAGSSEVVRYFSMSAATPEEKPFLVDEGGSISGSNFRFADASAYMIYQFDLPDDVNTAYAKIRIGNQFVIEAAAGIESEFQLEMNWVADSGQETRDISNLTDYIIDLSPYLKNNPTKIVRLRFSDALPADGWGPYLVSIVIQNTKGAAQGNVFTPVLESQKIFGEDIHNEYNKNYYTVDLSSVLANNPKKEFFVKFSDGSTGDGWGPGIFWMAAYSGELAIQNNRLVFNGLKTTQGDPANYGVNLFHSRYPVNTAKTLSAIALPNQSMSENNQVLLMAATLNEVVGAPILKVAKTTQNKVRLSWPSSASTFKLQNATNLLGTVSWTSVQETPQIVGEEYVIEYTPTGQTPKFYRLAK